MGEQLITAFCKGEELQQQIRAAKKAGTKESFDIWWLAQSGFLIQWNGVCVLFDPYLSDSLSKKYINTNKPHTRMSELVIAPHLLDGIEIVTSSHNHTDHLDGETLTALFKVNPEIEFIIPEANRVFVADRLKCPPDFPIGMNEGDQFEIKGFTFHGIPAAHNDVERDELGRCRFMGFIVQFGKYTIYHSGDTLWYDSLVDRLKPFAIDVAFLPINGNDPARGVAGNLNTEEAAQLGLQIGARLVIPHHYDLFTFNTANPEDFAREAEKLHQPYRILKLGEHGSYKN